MQLYEKKTKFFFRYSIFSGITMLITGVMFLGGPVLTLLLIAFEGIFASITGQEVVHEPEFAFFGFFKVVFLLLFMLAGLGLIIFGTVIIVKAVKRDKLIRHLKKEGQQINAEVIGCASSGIIVNNHPLLYLKCTYTDPYGKTYLFKSKCLHIDPMPFLPDGKVKVYCDWDDMNSYFVDVDGSLDFKSQSAYGEGGYKYTPSHWDNF